jgi:hypothetical protein
MLRIENETMTLLCSPGGAGLELIDRRRGTRWLLDEQTLAYGAALDPLTPLGAQLQGSDKLIVRYQAGEVLLEMAWALQDDALEVDLPVPAGGEIGQVTLPGSFIPQGEQLRLLLPIMQGMLWDGRGPAFSTIRAEGSHLGFSMAFLGYLGERGGLLVSAESRDDCRWWFGKDAAGRCWATNLQIDSLGGLRYPRRVRLQVVDADIVALAKAYRRKVIAQGRFKSWEAKIAERPALERLFGALMCYIGYCEDAVDYLAGCRKLQAYGFDRALVYPARFNIYFPNIHMGGVPAIHLSREQVVAIEALGYDVAPWSWLNEALDDGGQATRQMLRLSPAGQVIPHWAIDDQQWYQVCYSFLEAYQQRALREALTDMTWDHFDVLACVPPQECYALDHPGHRGHPLARSQDREWVRRTFRADQAAGRAVSSENFNDAYSLEYDLGSVKAWPQYGPWPFWPVPLTMLVYHDSLIHSWWELHSYNNPWRGRTAAPGFFEYGGGRPRLMATLDALMGCPPDVFPFGAQYGYSGRGKQTMLYRYRFEDPEVQLALREALPVARLHRRVGKQELVHFKILSEDGYVQETAFADGTRVVANFSRDVIGSIPGVDHRVIPEIASLMPESWQVLD